MAYNEQLANKISNILKTNKDIKEKKMFGGIAFLHKGKMALGVNKDNLVVKIPKEETEKYLKLPNTKQMDFTGKPMKGFIYVTPNGYKKSIDLKKWINIALTKQNSKTL